MKLYTLFLLMASVTILTPGPGVVMTLTNALRYGRRSIVGGILGLATGVTVVATLSATGLGVILAASPLAFSVIKYIGAAYLIWLGVRLWQAPAFHLLESAIDEARFGRRFVEGVTLQLTNPGAIFFFLSVFPQFIDHEKSYAPQFGALVVTFSTLLVGIHVFYALSARRARTWFASERSGRWINRVAGGLFVLMGTALATAKR